MKIEILQNEEISGGGNNRGGEEIDSAIRQRANKSSINVKEREQEKVKQLDVDPYIVRITVKQRARS